MSASLVGSEMCIRDRPFRRPDLGFWGLLGPRALLVFVCVERGDAAAVSYTHLTLPTICSV
eukprot:6980068-Alexandrium_andersonii.AAC.1